MAHVALHECAESHGRCVPGLSATGRVFRRSASAYLHAVGHFAHWLTDEHLTLQQLNESVVHRFITTHLPTCRCPGRCQRTAITVQAALGHLLDVLRADGRISARRVGLSPAIHDELERFTGYLDDICGLAAKTRAGRRWWIAQFLADRFGHGPLAMDRLIPRDIVDFLGHRGASYTPGIRRRPRERAPQLPPIPRRPVRRSRGGLDRLHPHGGVLAVGRLAERSHLGRNRSVPADLRSSVPRAGRRGYAMARCMVDLGLRVGEVAALQLDDVNWREGTVRIGAGKSRRIDVLPLPVLTGRALAAHLRHDRGRRASRAVFVRDRAPLDVPITTEIVRHAMDTAFVRCGLGSRFTGTHVLRRTAATQMRLAGATLKQIADLLRHRSLDTTTIYTKIDRRQLATMAAPWPGGVA